MTVDLLLHVLLLLLMPPLLLGVINKTKALFAGRKGAPFLQPYFDILKLLRKSMVLSSTTTWIFIAAPVVTLSCVLMAGLMIPMAQVQAPVAFTGSLVLFAYLFGLSRFFTVSAALDTGSAFEGMGGARELTFACLSEPALFLALLALARIGASPDLLATPQPIVAGNVLAASLPLASGPLVLLAIGLFLVLLAENCRIPVDDPNTHLELTMIHEVMVLDHSGPLFGLILYGAAMKLFVIGALFLHTVVLFRSGNPALDWLMFISEMLGLAVVVGIVESVMARLSMRRVPLLLMAAVMFCGFGLILLVR